MKKPLKYIEFLDALRAIAILAVLLCHTYAEAYGYGNEFSPWNGWLRKFAGGANLWLYPLSWGRGGVALFFVISGLCIHLSFHHSGQGWSNFYIRRFFRLYPAYLTALIFVSAMLYMRHLSAALQQGHFWFQFSTHLFFIHNFFNPTFKGINPALWSLAVEVQLYLIYPLLLALVVKLGWRRTLLMLAIVEFFIQGSNGWVEMAGAAGTIGGHMVGILGNSPFGYWFSWALGAAIADALIKKQPLPCLKVHPLVWLAAAVSTDFVKPLQPLYFMAFALASAGIISRCLKRSKPGVGTSLLASRTLKNIGLWSYSIYLLHYPLLEVYYNSVDWYVPQTHQSRPFMLLLMLGTWVIIIPLGMLWYKTIELPGLSLGKRIANGPVNGVPLQSKTKPQPCGN